MVDDLIDFIDQWTTKRVMLVGDFMLDHYVYGNAQRLSPDAPVPVLAVEDEKHSPGGAGHVCLDMQALKLDVACVGIIGQDNAGEELKRVLQESGACTDGLVEVPGRRTTVKRSFVGLAQHRHPQKMFRVDYESREPLDVQTKQQLLAVALAGLDSVDVVCIEDYDKGVVDESLAQAVIKEARERGIPVLVDPAAIKDYSRYVGATCLTPNRTEAEVATGLLSGDSTSNEALALKLMKTVQTDAMVLTLDKHGALLLERGQEARTVPTVARSVYDVTGAGDMVLAMLAGTIANAAQWVDAVRLANIAAGLEVERFGAVPIPLDDIHVSLIEMRRSEVGKIRTVDQLQSEVRALRNNGKRIAFTNGCFDILHSGHVTYLREARKTGDLLIVAVNRDVSIRNLKGPERPIVSEQDRLTVLSELECVDYLILFGDGSGGEGDTPIPLLHALQPDILVKGGDYTRDQVVGHEVVDAYGGEVQLIDVVAGRSTTNIVERIKSAN